MPRKDKALDQLHNLTFQGNFITYIKEFRRLHLILHEEISVSSAAYSFFRPLPTEVRKQISMLGKDKTIQDIEDQLLILAKEEHRGSKYVPSSEKPSYQQKN